MVLKGIYYPEMSKIWDGTSSYSNIYDAFNKVDDTYILLNNFLITMI